jgi:hypothetical protein
MAEWRVQLQGDQFDLQEIKEILLGHDPCIIEEGSNFYLTSKAWDKLQEPREVHSQAKDFIQLLAAQLGFLPSLDHSIRSIQHRLRNRETDLLRCFQIDHQLELLRLLHGKVGGLGAF